MYHLLVGKDPLRHANSKDVAKVQEVHLVCVLFTVVGGDARDKGATKGQKGVLFIASRTVEGGDARV